ncbi:unnamed protein product [Paramecium pentaurelia]|uniref:Uncharacterized protein n=1 Tax=Paramecium pentaurelia TaxID=43138 RepID=A0A8S1XXS7_9CILI|nr:unnamed protein product [Paramecium pentaurelia]
MGICSSRQKDNLLSDVDNIPLLTRGQLGFDIIVENIKVKMDDIQSCKVKVIISNYSSFETEIENEIQGQFYFKHIHKFQLKSNEEQLKQQFVIVELKNEKDEQISTFNLNLYQIATGPFHFDYEISQLGSRKHGKVSFDFKMAQILIVRFIPKLIDFNLEEPLNKHEYCFQLRMLTSQLQFHSEYSPVFQNQLFYKTQQIQSNKQILWKDSKVEMEVEVPLIEITSSSIQIALFHIGKDGKKEIECEAYVNLNYALNQKAEQIIDKGIKSYKIDWKQNNRRVWNHGVLEGILNYHLEIILPFHLKQQIVGVRTDKGLSQGTRVINQAKASIREIQQLSSAGQGLLDTQYIIFSKTEPDSQLIQQQNDFIIQIIDNLKLSHKQSMVCFEYKTQQDLFNSQKLLIDLAIKLLETADQQQETLREQYYTILKLIMNRGELSLAQLGFSDQTQKTNEKLLKLKMEIGLTYQIFLQKGLSITLEKLKQKSLAQNERSFVENFFANAYFRVPEFRNRIIVCVQRTDDEQIPEWRSLTKSTGGIPNQEFNDIFDWNKHFYEYLMKQPKYYANNHKMNEIINQQMWQNQLGKRGTVFFLFIQEWCDLLNTYIINTKNVPYHQLPGYFQLIKAFFVELKTRQISNYPESLKIALCSLLRNTNLLNTIIIILFSKVSLYNSDDVVHCLDLLNKCFLKISQFNLCMPSFLDQKYFLKGIRVILTQSEHAQSIAKCLELIYTNYILFPVDLKKELTDMIFENLAIKFFIHWSYNVRLIFRYFLIYRIFHLHKPLKDREFNEEDLIEKYQEQLKPKKQHSYFDQRNSSKQIISEYIYLKYIRFMQQIEEGKHLKQQKTCHLNLNNITRIEELKYKLNKLQSKLNNREKDDSFIQHSFKIIPNNQIDDTVLPIQTTEQNSEKLVLNKGKLPIQQIILSEIQLKYLIISCSEYEDSILQYQKWRQTNIPDNYNTLKEEQILTVIESFVVPVVRILEIQDKNEGNLIQRDDW